MTIGSPPCSMFPSGNSRPICSSVVHVIAEEIIEKHAGVEYDTEQL
jgi:hypothetical protein